jgi:hypothetical protein
MGECGPHGVVDVGTGIEHDQAIRWWMEDACRGRRRIGKPPRQAPRQRGVRHGACHTELEAPRSDNWTICAEVGQLAGDSQQRQVIVDDDHSVNAQIGVVARKQPGPVGKLGGELAENLVEVRVLGEVELTIDNAANEVAARRPLGRRSGIEPGLLGLREVNVGAVHAYQRTPRDTPRRDVPG